jgi:NRPS condensation-like uncharacterized protein
MHNHRKLGRLEQNMEMLNSHARTWNLVTISRIKNHLDQEYLRRAIELIKYRHPRLNSRIIYSPKGLYFQPDETPKIALRVVNKLDNEQWQEVVNEEFNEEINSSRGLLRVVLVYILSDEQICYLITTVHHAVADGLSSIHLHSEILTYCQKIASGELINPIDSLTTLPPVEELLPQWTKDVRGKISSSLLLLQIAFQKIWHRPQSLGCEDYAPINKRRSNIIHRQLDPELTQKFVNRCRQENATVHSALCAVLMFIVAKKIIKGNSNKIPVSCLSYVDLRRRLEPAISEEHMSVLAASTIGFHTIKTNTSFWKLARQVKQKLEVNIKHGDIFKMILIAKQLIDFCFISPKEVAATVSVSNSGKVNIPKTYGEFELEEISFASSHALYASVFVIHTTTFRDKMLLNFVYSQPSISRHTMEELVNNVMSGISDFCTLNLDKSFLSWIQN